MRINEWWRLTFFPIKENSDSWLLMKRATREVRKQRRRDDSTEDFNGDIEYNGEIERSERNGESAKNGDEGEKLESADGGKKDRWIVYFEGMGEPLSIF